MFDTDGRPDMYEIRKHITSYDPDNWDTDVAGDIADAIADTFIQSRYAKAPDRDARRDAWIDKFYDQVTQSVVTLMTPDVNGIVYFEPDALAAVITEAVDAFIADATNDKWDAVAEYGRWIRDLPVTA
jgi:hypothetical protein